MQKRKYAPKNCKLTTDHKHNLEWLLGINLSPEQIAGRMKFEESSNAVSTQTLYRWIDNLGWRERLPRKGKRYRKRAGIEAGARLIPNRVDIDERPSIVEQNKELGHWEGDTVHGQDGYFVTLVERVSKVFLTLRVCNKSKKAVARAIRKMLKPYLGMCKTNTFDNGGEYAGHALIAKALNCRIYFAKPYHSWQRRLSENSNGLLRRYFPKGIAIGALSQKKINNAIFRITTRPRKALNYRSTYEFMTGQRVPLML